VNVFREHADEITFVLMDLTMPNMDGYQALAEIRRMRPDIKAVMMSGYASDDVASRQQEHAFNAFIQKPCDLDTFKKVVYQMVGVTM